MTNHRQSTRPLKDFNRSSPRPWPKTLPRDINRLKYFSKIYETWFAVTTHKPESFPRTKRHHFERQNNHKKLVAYLAESLPGRRERYPEINRKKSPIPLPRQPLRTLRRRCGKRATKKRLPYFHLRISRAQLRMIFMGSALLIALSPSSHSSRILWCGRLPT